MRRFISILLLFILAGTAITTRAQSDELDKLVDLVKSLQTGGEGAYNNAISALAKDPYWTPMDELGFDRNVECKVSDRVPGFRLNSVLTNAENKERYQTTTGNHLNGADLRYNYSLFEKTLKPGKTATFALPERWGSQTLIIIPYDPNSSLRASVNNANDRDGVSSGEVGDVYNGGSGNREEGDNEFTVTSLGNGILKLTGTVEKGKMMNLSITNDSDQNVSYVIINYNSRK